MSPVLPQPAAPDPASAPDIAAAYASCRRLVRSSRSVEYSVMQLMPAALRPACWAMYAAAVTTDALVDDEEGSPAERAARLQAWVDALRAELSELSETGFSPAGPSADGPSRAGRSHGPGGDGPDRGDPVRRALADTIRTWQLDVETLTPVFTALREDASGRRPQTWREWSLRTQAENTPWAMWCLTLLTRAGVPTTVRQEHLEAMPAFLDGLYLTDTLTDLASDLGRGILTLPEEALAAHGVAEADLLARRWTPPVEALIAGLTDQADEWLEQPALQRGVHPGMAVLLRTSTDLFRARVRTARRLGPALLHRTAELSPAVRLRLLAPARVRAVRAWRRAALVQPAEPVVVLPEPRREADPAFLPPVPPRPHPSGECAPDIPAERLPRHVGVIMDGNGRWAAQQGLPRSEGHRVGSDATRDVVHGALELGLSHLTLYAFSTENWRRDASEVARLFRTMHDTLRDSDLRSLDVRLRWAGSPEGLPVDLVDALRQSARDSRHRTGLTLTLCVNYGGRAELVQAAAGLARAAAAGELDPDHIDERLLAAHLPHPHLPEVDLLWRTGGEHRISNFLPWHLSYSELHFTDTLWPEVDRRDLWRAVSTYTQRRRRHGAAPVVEGTRV
ncbi:polyprenyl diphosphate synthase [Streptomyces sp. GTA36]